MGAYAVRDLHVASTDRECIRHVLGKLHRGWWHRRHRYIRREILRDALAAHHRNQALVREFRL